MCAGLIEESVALRDGLRGRGVRVWALSNFAVDSWERARRLYPALGGFDGLVLSGREGCVKPEARIYEIIEERTGARGPALFLIDDRAKNVEAARARGWRGHVFAGAEGLEADLRDAGFET